MFSLTSFRLSLLFVVMSLGIVATAQNKIPQFRDYPVDEVYSGQTPHLDLDDDTDEIFKAKLKEAAKENPNFAGHYILAIWGCGTECLMGAAIDARTGKIYAVPHTFCCWGDVDNKFRSVEFRLKSRLIVFSGARDEKEGDNGAHFYKFENGKFMHIRSIHKSSK